MNTKYSSHNAFRALIVAILFHNAEEAFMICKYPIVSPIKALKPLNCEQFLVAVSIISFAVVIAYIIAAGAKKASSYLLISTAIASAMFLNVFVPHLLTAIYLASYTPGIVTAITLILPLGFITLSKNKSASKTRKQFFSNVALGLVFGYLFFAGILQFVLFIVK
jgi:hypothetical protein